ncbi:MAG TPA: DNA polymerase III, subunit gamma and tau [Elusimicrobia bacterium]|nr:MAG: DNA polymerase III, subunit gamma and tau [Elusimicrobia bacterium GWF2_62_30]HBA60204.1 DNA polymerase III, subunit gamma and tau [Elusimicrobiota bacterium]
MYENFATKYRPGNLGEVLGQDTIKVTLANAVKLGRIAHSYVFYGPRGCGKTTIARILAKTLNCHQPKNGVPCGKCPSCVEITESKSLDVIEIDAASNTGVDKVRSVIIENVDFAPSRDKYKIYILDEVHMLSTGAFNALLKTVEEPPAHVVFIMATTEQNKVPLTILSRSQSFRFRPISEADIFARLKEVAEKEKVKFEPEALKLISRSSEGAMRDAMTTLDRAVSFGHGEVKAEIINDLLGHPGPEVVNSLALALAARDAAGLHAAFDRINAEGQDPLGALRDLRNLFAEAFLSAHGFSREEAPIKGLPKDLPAAALARLSRKLTVIIEEIKFSDALSLAAEIALFTLIETPVELESLVRRLEGLEGRLSSQPAAPAEQKKNDSAPVPAPAVAAPRQAQPAPAAAAPVPADAWKKFLGVVGAKKPGLYNVLLSVKLNQDSADAWRLLSSNKFEVTMIERALPELEEMLARTAGRKIKLSAAHAAPAAVSAPVRQEDDGAGADSEETVLEDDMPPELARKAAAARPQEPEVVEAGTEPELKHLAKVFHGRISRINKVKGPGQ